MEEHILKVKHLCKKKKNCKWQNGGRHVLSVMEKIKIGSDGVT